MNNQKQKNLINIETPLSDIEFTFYNKEALQKIDRDNLYKIFENIKSHRLLDKKLFMRGIGLAIFSIVLKIALEKSVEAGFKIMFSKDKIILNPVTNDSNQRPKENLAENLYKLLKEKKGDDEFHPPLPPEDILPLEPLEGNPIRLKLPPEFEPKAGLPGLYKRHMSGRMFMIRESSKLRAMLIIIYLIYFYLNGDLSLADLKEFLGDLYSQFRSLIKKIIKWGKIIKKKFKQLFKSKQFLEDFLYIFHVLQTFEMIAPAYCKSTILTILFLQLQRALLEGNLDDKMLLYQVSVALLQLNLPFNERIRILTFIMYHKKDLIKRLKRINNFFE